MTDPVDLAALRPSQAEGLSDQTLEELNRLWTIVRAFSTTAHDVNNALQVIAGSAELLEARELDPAVRRRVEIVRQESAKAAATMNRLLDFARAPRQPIGRVDVWAVVDVAVSMRLASVGRSRITLTVNRDAAEPAWIVAEHARVLQMLLDLLLVAEGRLAGRARGRIDVSVHSGADGVTLRVVLGSDAPDVEGADVSNGANLPEGLTKDAELWAAAYLAALNGGVLTVEQSAMSVSWPPA